MPDSSPRSPPSLAPEAIWQDTWERLGEAVSSARHPFHLGTFATVRSNAPELRTVVLRAVDAPHHRVTFHTDLRSPKARDLSYASPASWLFYDAKARLQLRLSGTATLHSSGAMVDKRWQASRPQSQACYRHRAGPGSVLDNPLDYLAGETSLPTLTDTGREHFAIVVTEVSSVDWLSLHHAGHRRLQFTLDGAGVRSTWVAP